MHNLRKALGAVALGSAAALSIGGSASAGNTPAPAAPAHSIVGDAHADPTPLLPTAAPVGNFWLTNSPSFGWTTHGLGNQLTIQSSGQTAFYLAATTSQGYYKIHPEGSDGHCVTDDNTSLDIQNCAQGATNQWFGAFSLPPGCFFKSFAHSDRTVVTYDNVNNKPIWDDNNGGGWRKWSSGLYPC